MNKKLIYAAFFLAAISFSHTAVAQSSTTNLPTYKIAIFAPLYLDSVFDENNTLRLKQGIPKFINPGLEFIHGAQVALDSMHLSGENVDAYIYDSKSTSKSIPDLIDNKDLDNIDLIIGSVKDIELKQLADFAFTQKIPFVSATYPNDGGITSNPYFIIPNSTLKSHCEAIYSFVFQTHGGDKVFLCRKKGSQEDKVAAYFKNINEPDGKPLVNIQTINFDSSISKQLLLNKLDSNRQTVIIGGSLDENFAANLANLSKSLSKVYSITLIGMPNWENFNSLYKKDAYKDFPIYFTSPYFNDKTDNYSNILKNAFSKRYKGKPTDMAYKGFETVYLFTKLLTRHPDDFMEHLNDTTDKVFNDFNFKPISLKKSKTPDYIENKHVYFIQILNGVLSKAW
ncbi:MAG: ABC transporter substrate-binding protein [Chitinophagaceae bacterium]|nr:ABC transporter substrate-binding protein [Chitinophagaceae bacterium]